MNERIFITLMLCVLKIHGMKIHDNMSYEEYANQLDILYNTLKPDYKEMKQAEADYQAETTMIAIASIYARGTLDITRDEFSEQKITNARDSLSNSGQEAGEILSDLKAEKYMSLMDNGVNFPVLEQQLTEARERFDQTGQLQTKVNSTHSHVIDMIKYFQSPVTILEISISESLRYPQVALES